MPRMGAEIAFCSHLPTGPSSPSISHHRSLISIISAALPIRTSEPPFESARCHNPFKEASKAFAVANHCQPKQVS